MSRPGESLSAFPESRQSPRETCLRLKAVHRPLAGECQSLLVTGSDGNLYALKMVHPAYTPSMRASEALASLLAAWLELPVAEWSPMLVDTEVSRWRPDFRFSSPYGPTEPHPGLFYASRVPMGQGGQPPYEIIPQAWHHRIVNRGDCAAMAIFDLWIVSLHARQIIFVPDEEGNRLRAIFIDHCHALGGPNRLQVTRPENILYENRAIYEGLWSSEAVQGWIDRIQQATPEVVHGLIDQLPASWVSDSWRSFVVHLLGDSQRWLGKASALLPRIFRTACKRHQPTVNSASLRGLS